MASSTWRAETILRTNRVTNPATRGTIGEQVLATNLFPDPNMTGGVSRWAASGGTVAAGPEGGIKLTSTGTGYVIATDTYAVDQITGLAGATTLYASFDVRVTGTVGVGVQIAQANASGTSLGNATNYVAAPAPGMWARVGFAIPLSAGIDHSTQVQLIRSSGGAVGITTEWRNPRFSTSSDGPFFTGSTLADDAFTYRWIGTANASPSQKVAIKTSAVYANSLTDSHPPFRVVRGGQTWTCFDLLAGKTSAGGYFDSPGFVNGDFVAARFTVQAFNSTDVGKTFHYQTYDGASVSGFLTGTLSDTPTEFIVPSSRASTGSTKLYIYPYDSAPVLTTDVLLEKVSGAGVAPGAYFDGSTPAETGDPLEGGDVNYRWISTVDGSASQAYLPLALDRPLLNGQFQLDDTVFGTESSGYPLLPGGFVVGNPDITVQDKQLPLGNGTMFGNDYRSGITYTWQLLVHQEYFQDRWPRAAQLVSDFASLWQNREVNTTPRAVDELRIYHGIAPGRIYGRCRNFAADRSAIRKGIASLTFDFVSADDLVYDDVLSVLTLDLLQLSGTGWASPWSSPWTTGAANVRQGFATVGGSADTWATIQINGPCGNPSLTMDNQQWIETNTQLAAGESLTIDTRPWVRTAMKGSSSAAGVFTSGTVPLEDMKLKPGQHEFVYTATDPTGTSTATISWRNARHQP